MILPFKTYLPVEVPPFANKERTYFRTKIQSGEKQHTLRMGDRWRPGLTIQFWLENPRYPQRDPKPFSLDHHLVSYWGQHRDQPAPLVSAIENWSMVFRTDVPLEEQHDFLYFCDQHWKHPKSAGADISNQVATRDGLTPKQFKYWFYKSIRDLEIEAMKLQGKWVKRKPLKDQPQWPHVISGKGQLIHWTNKLYFDDMAIKYTQKAKV